MIKNFLRKLRNIWGKDGVQSDDIKYYQSALHFQPISSYRVSSYKMKSPWKVKSSWKYDYWKK